MSTKCKSSKSYITKIILVIILTSSFSYIFSTKLDTNIKERELQTCDSNCATCSINRRCTACKNGYYLTSNSCTACKVSNCYKCSSNGVCSACNTGYTLQSNTCSLTTPTPTCVSGLYLDTLTKTCLACSDKLSNCTTCSNPTTFICSSCAAGYYLSGKLTVTYTCEKCPTNCNCLNTYGCTSCVSSLYQLYNGQCLPPCENPDPSCNSCVGDAICLSCNDGYYLEAEKCPSCPDVNCQNCLLLNAKVTCIKCASPYEMHTQYEETMCVPAGANCDIFNADLTCSMCKDGYYLDDNGKCLTCNADEYSINNQCQKCSDFGACSQCFQYGCRTCLENSEFNKDFIYDLILKCECLSGFYFIGSSCISEALIFVPTFVGFALIIITICLICCKRRLSNNNVRNPGAGVNNHNENVALRDLEVDNVHGNTCVFGDDSPPFWKLNCGGYLCNNCSMKVLGFLGENNENVDNADNAHNADNVGENNVVVNNNYIANENNAHNNDADLNSNGHLNNNHNNHNENPPNQNCPKCNVKFVYFDFVNRILSQRNNQIQLDTSNSIQNQIKKVHEEGNKDEGDKCNICFFLPNSKAIHCNSAVPHLLCSYCYKRLILIEKIKLCPFCRSEIKSS